MMSKELYHFVEGSGSERCFSPMPHQ